MCAYQADLLSCCNYSAMVAGVRGVLGRSWVRAGEPERQNRADKLGPRPESRRGATLQEAHLDRSPARPCFEALEICEVVLQVAAALRCSRSTAGSRGLSGRQSEELFLSEVAESEWIARNKLHLRPWHRQQVRQPFRSQSRALCSR